MRNPDRSDLPEADLGFLTVDFCGPRVTRSSGERRNWVLWRWVGNLGMVTHGMRPITVSKGDGYEFREFAVAFPDCGYFAQCGRSHMVSGLDETSWSLACPRCTGCIPFCRCGLHSPGFRCHLAERHVGQADGLDLPDFWVYGRRVGQCADSARRSLGGNAQIHPGCCNGRGAEPTDAITAGCLSPQRGVRFWLGGRSVLR